MDFSIILILVAVLGLVIGSFLNVVICRYPKMLAQQWKEDCMKHLKQPITYKPRKFNLITPRSYCPKCQKKLKPWHNIPLLSYLFLCGKCAYCKKCISPVYPIVELLSAAVALIVLCRFGVTWPGLLAVIFSWGLIVLSFIDFRHQILPDDLTLSLLWLGLLSNAFFYYTTPTYAIIGALMGYLFLWAIAKLFTLIRKKNGMGHGDFKMFSMLGAWIGISILLNVLLTSVIVALVISLLLIAFKKLSNKNPIPFGPYLALGGWVTFIFGPTLSDWITRIVTYV